MSRQASKALRPWRSVIFRSGALAFILGGALSSGCKASPKEERSPKSSSQGLNQKQAQKVLARVGDRTITAGDFAQFLDEQSPYLRNHYRSPERRRELLDNMVNFELLALEATKRGYHRDPDITRIEAQLMIDAFLKDTIDAKLRLESISDKAVEEYYRDHSQEYNKPAQVRVSHILLADKQTAAQLLRNILANQNDDTYFNRMAKQFSLDERNRNQDGDLNFISQTKDRMPSEPTLPGPLVSAAFKLKNIGDIYPHVIETPEGYHVLRLTAKREALKRSLEEVRRPIQNLLLQQRREQLVKALVDDLRSKAKIQENLERLKDVHLDAQAS